MRKTDGSFMPQAALPERGLSQAQIFRRFERNFAGVCQRDAVRIGRGNARGRGRRWRSRIRLDE
jgi:hypothetical protein